MKTRKALLYMSNFYSYKNEIIDELLSQGFETTFFCDEMTQNSLQRVVGKIFRNYSKKKFYKYFCGTLDKVKSESFDIIIIIFGGLFFNKAYLKMLKECFRGTPIVYYAWDSMHNFPNIKELLCNADYSFSFDKDDCDNTGATFLPLFYSKAISNLDERPLCCLDVSLVMSFYIEKNNGLMKLLELLPDGLRSNFYLKIRDRLYFRKMCIFHGKKINKIKKYFNLEPMQKNDLFCTFLSSKAVIDCPLPNQKGLTIRTFEALSLGTKIITLNKDIKNYDFYTPNNIFVVGVDELENGRIPRSFFETDFDVKYLPSKDYSIKHFVRTLTGVIER